MKLRKRTGNWIVFGLGTVGLVMCVVALIGVWKVQSRVNRMSDQLSQTLDRSLTLAQQRLVQTRNHVQESRISVEEIQDTVKQWTREQTADNLKSRLDIANRADQLTSTLQRVDDGLDGAELLFEHLQEGLSLANAIGASFDGLVTTDLNERIAQVRNTLAELDDATKRIQQLTSTAIEDADVDTKRGQLRELSIRCVATLVSVESALDRLNTGIDLAKERVQAVNTRAQSWLQLVAISLSLLLVWMGTGQAVLARLGWKGRR